MSHEPFREMMAAALDGPLAPADRAHLDAHLDSCTVCRGAWHGLLEVDGLFRTAPTIAPPAGFTARAAARLARRQSRPRVLGGGLMLGMGALALIAVAFVPLAGALFALLGQPGTIVALLRALAALINALDVIGSGLWLALTALLDWIVEQPFSGAAALGTLPLIGLWIYFFKRFSPKAVPA